MPSAGRAEPAKPQRVQIGHAQGPCLSDMGLRDMGQRIGADIIRPHQWNVGHCTDSESIDHENDDPVEPAVRYWHGRFHL